MIIVNAAGAGRWYRFRMIDIFPRSTVLPAMRWRTVLAALVALPVVGCGSYAPEISDRAVMPGYSEAEVQSLAGRTIRVEVYGNPFAEPEQAFDGQVAANMSQSADAPAHFAVHPPSDATTPYHVVWNFSPPRDSLAPHAICTGKSIDPNKAGMPIDAYAAFCRGGEALSSVRGRLYYPDTSNSLEFIALVDAMTSQLFAAAPAAPRRSGDAPLGRPLGHPF